MLAATRVDDAQPPDVGDALHLHRHAGGGEAHVLEATPLPGAQAHLVFDPEHTRVYADGKVVAPAGAAEAAV